MKRALFAGLCGVVCVVTLSSAVRSQEGAPGMMTPSPEEMKAMMERMQAAMKPGPEHAELARWAGSYDLTVKMWMGGPGGPPVEMKGTAEIRSIHDGRFMIEEQSYEMMMPNAAGGMDKRPHKGLGITGYNNFRRMYETVWCDSLNTQIIKLSGTRPPGSNVTTFYGEMDEPMLNVVGRTIKGVSRVLDDDRFTFEIIDLHAGDNYKVLEMTYARKK